MKYLGQSFWLFFFIYRKFITLRVDRYLQTFLFRKKKRNNHHINITTKKILKIYLYIYICGNKRDNTYTLLFLRIVYIKGDVSQTKYFGIKILNYHVHGLGWPSSLVSIATIIYIENYLLTIPFNYRNILVWASDIINKMCLFVVRYFNFIYHFLLKRKILKPITQCLPFEYK